LLDLSFPIELDIMLTWKCQCNCIFCEPWVGHNRTKFPGEMTTEQVLQIVKDASSHGPCLFFLTGGEPFLRKDLPDIIAYFTENNLIYEISSNGLFDEQILDAAIDAGLKSFQISIMGKNSYQRVTQSKNEYTKVLSNVRLAADKGLHVKVSIVPLIFNLDELTSIAQDVCECGAKVFRILRFMPFRPYMLKWAIPLGQLASRLPEVYEICQRHGVVLDVNETPTGHETYPVSDKFYHPMETTCPAGKRRLTILPDGQAVPCYSMIHKELLLGNVLTEGIEQVWNNPRLVEFRKMSPSDYTGPCSTCENKEFCYSCRAIALNCSGSIYASDISCYKSQEYWSDRCNDDQCVHCVYDCSEEFKLNYG